MLQGIFLARYNIGKTAGTIRFSFLLFDFHPIILRILNAVNYQGLSAIEDFHGFI